MVPSNLVNSEAYKDKLTRIRQQQKNMIKEDSVCKYPTNFTLDGSLSKGKKLIKDNVRQIIRSFNNECESVIDKVKFNNIESIRKRIEKSYNNLNKMNSGMRISISYHYLDLKLKELDLSHEYALKKQQEQEELQLLSCNDTERSALEIKKQEITSQLDTIQQSINDLDYRTANAKAGYVYVISNIGAFGENVFKIGMTRRLEPTERVYELGDASVPFNFDIHAMIFADDAPALESALHKAFEDRKVNMINKRREFFKVTLDEIESVVKANFDKTVEFTKIAPAEQYRESLLLSK